MKEFNVTGLCIPEEHYMADVRSQIDQIAGLVRGGKYFTMNRARQYGKTTMLNLLSRKLESEYLVLFLSFESVDDIFSSMERFIRGFQRLVWNELDHLDVEPSLLQGWTIEQESIGFLDLNERISWLCKSSNKKVVLLIDEVDKSSDNQIFLSFLGMLREKYLNRYRRPTFHSVVLAGVYDVKNLKLKIRPDEERTWGIFSNVSSSRSSAPVVLNSPWNIAVKFDVDMSLNIPEIASMLEEYEEDHHTGMNIVEVAQAVYEYTSGYPFLVSYICQEIHNIEGLKWIAKSIPMVVKQLLTEKITLFDDIAKNLGNNKDLFDFMYNLLIRGFDYRYMPDNPVMDLALIFGFVKNQDNKVRIHNKIFEIRICEYFISIEKTSSNHIPNLFPNEVVKNGVFDMELCLKKFSEHYQNTYNEKDEKFLERQCRLLFLTYLQPLINGVGFYELETQTADEKRLDIVVIYGTNRFIVELKLWYGEKKHEEAYQQLVDYLVAKNESTGYLLTFDFRKKREQSSKWVEVEGKRILDVIA